MRRSGKLLLTLGLAISLMASIAHAAEPREGKDYASLPQIQATDSKDKIEVTEFFWYGCPHCYELEPTLAKWLKTLPKDVVFRRVPADFGRWTGGVKLYYALEATGDLERVHKELFDAIHLNRLNFNLESEVADWLAKKGVDRKKFTDAYNSFGVQSKVSRAQQLTQAHKLNGVPALVVGGKYITTNAMVGSYEGLPPVLDSLIVKVRNEQKKK